MVGNNPQTAYLNPLSDLVVTFVCWIYFIFAFLFFFSFFYIAAFCFPRSREQSFQYLNNLFFKGFMWLLGFLAPRHKWAIDSDISSIRGSIIVCNHLSYLDPLLFISLLPRQKTIVKTKFFRAPVFGWLIKVSGYIPSTTEGVYARRMIEQVEGMGKFFQSGGNLFVFPEGTRNTDDGLGEFHRGVFKIGRMYRCPIHVLRLCNTDKLFTPGKFLFNTRVQNHIKMEVLGCIEPPPGNGQVSARALESKVRQLYESHSSYRNTVQ